MKGRKSTGAASPGTASEPPSLRLNLESASYQCWPNTLPCSIRQGPSQHVSNSHFPPPPAKTQRRQVTHEEWTEDDDPTDSSTQVGDNITLRGQTQVIAPTNIFPLDTTSITTPRSGHQKRGRENVKTPPTTSSKRRHTEQEAPPQPALTQAVAVAADMTLATVPTQQEKGQSSQISEKDVFALRDMPAEAFELAALLQHGTAYELIDFLARLQVAAAARMATEHAERQVIERALDNEPASDDEPKLQRVGRKRALKKRRTRIELPELNTALVDTYKELDYATRAAKDMAANIKIARQQAKRATDLWHNSEQQRAELEQQLTLAQTAPSTARLSCSTDATTQTETHPTDPVTTVSRLLSTATQTDPEDTLRIQQLEEEVASYKAIADKAKERLEENRHAAEEREAALQRTIQAQQQDADDKLSTAISSFQDIATAQIATLTRELKLAEGNSAMFLQRLEATEKERDKLYADLLEHQTAAMRDREAEHTRHLAEVEQVSADYSKRIDQILAETEARAKSLNSSYEIITAKLQLKVTAAQTENRTLQTQLGEREERINALVVKQRQLLNRKIDETLDEGWKKWSAQAAELQVLRTDAENRQKDGKGFFKMDTRNISIVREDLEEDFRALADGHTKAITALLEEFNDEQMVFRLAAEKALGVNPEADQATSPGHNNDPPQPALTQPQPIDGSHTTPAPDLPPAHTEGIWFV